ncbi:MAG TPA: Ig-like domain-containing protein [Candidatus Acidoferrales bacterium]|jgi:hypothetical protein|nr:Ig-like domain-containing protein [Candidatus Acidoferrales bacterium]
MKIFHNSYQAGLGILAGVVSLLFMPVPTRAANVFWTGPAYTYTHNPYDSSADMLTTNHSGADFGNNVWLTRDVNYPLYNAAAESGWNSGVSPTNTLWVVASGPLTNAASLKYDLFANVVGHPGDSPGSRVGVTFYVNIPSDHIYLSLQLTAWGNNDGGSFSYIRSTPAILTSTISLTNPASGAVFAAPASLKLAASVTGGTVTNVQFFANAASLGSVATAPFSFTSGSLTAGAYALTAVATASGISTTSAVVNVTVVNPVTPNISQPQMAGGQFSLNYTANPGLSYLVQTSSNLVNWKSLITNIATTSPVPFSVTSAHTGTAYYRVGRLPNP